MTKIVENQNVKGTHHTRKSLANVDAADGLYNLTFRGRPGPDVFGEDMAELRARGFETTRAPKPMWVGASSTDKVVHSVEDVQTLAAREIHRRSHR